MEAKIETARIDPGKPSQNGANESLIGKYRHEYRGMQSLQNQTEARTLMNAWRREYNPLRPHSSLGDLTSAQFVERCTTTQQTVAVSQGIWVRRSQEGQQY
jgi:putative transposase